MVFYMIRLDALRFLFTFNVVLAFYSDVSLKFGFLSRAKNLKLIGFFLTGLFGCYGLSTAKPLLILAFGADARNMLNLREIGVAEVRAVEFEGLNTGKIYASRASHPR